LVLTLNQKCLGSEILSFHFQGHMKKKIKTHNILSLMLDARFKSFCFVFSYVGKGQGMFIVEECDRRALYPMLVKSYNHLHLVGDVISSCV